MGAGVGDGGSASEPLGVATAATLSLGGPSSPTVLAATESSEAAPGRRPRLVRLGGLRACALGGPALPG